MAEGGRAWESRMTRQVAEGIAYWRGQQHLSAEKLSQRCTALGYPVPRNTLTNLENGRRQTISLGELLTIAAALQIPPLALVLPLGRADVAEIAPDLNVSIDDALNWVDGHDVNFIRDGARPARDLNVFARRIELLIELIDQHRAFVEALGSEHLASGVAMGSADHVAVYSKSLKGLAETRASMRSLDLVPSRLPADLAADVGEEVGHAS